MYLYFPDGMLIHHRVTTVTLSSLVPISIPGWRNVQGPWPGLDQRTDWLSEVQWANCKATALSLLETNLSWRRQNCELEIANFQSLNPLSALRILFFSWKLYNILRRHCLGSSRPGSPKNICVREPIQEVLLFLPFIDELSLIVVLSVRWRSRITSIQQQVQFFITWSDLHPDK